MANSLMSVTRVEIDSVKMRCAYLQSLVERNGVELFASQVQIYSNLLDSIERIISFGKQEHSPSAEKLQSSSKSWFFHSNTFSKLSKVVGDLKESTPQKTEIFTIRNLYFSLLGYSAGSTSIRSLLFDKIVQLNSSQEKSITDVFLKSVTEAFVPVISSELKATVESLDSIRASILSKPSAEKTIKKQFPFYKKEEDLQQYYGEGIHSKLLQNRIHSVLWSCFPQSLERVHDVIRKARAGVYGTEAKDLVEDSSEQVVNREFLIRIILIHYFKEKINEASEINFSKKHCGGQQETEEIVEEVKLWMKEEKIPLDELIKDMFFSEEQRKYKNFSEKVNQLVGRFTFYFLENQGTVSSVAFDGCFRDSVVSQKCSEEEKRSHINNTLVVKTFCQNDLYKKEALSQIKDAFRELCTDPLRSDLDQKLLAIFIELIIEEIDDEIPSFINQLPEAIKLDFFIPVVKIWNFNDLSQSWVKHLFDKISDGNRKVELLNIYLSVQRDQNLTHLSSVIALMDNLEPELRKRVSLEQFLAVLKACDELSTLSKENVQKIINLYCSIKVLKSKEASLERNHGMTLTERDQRYSVYHWTYFEQAVDELIKREIAYNQVSAKDLQEILDDLMGVKGFAWRRIQAKIMNYSLKNPTCFDCSEFSYKCLKGDLAPFYFESETISTLQYTVTSLIVSQMYHQTNLEELKESIDYFRNLLKQNFEDDEEDYDLYLAVMQQLENFLKHQKELTELFGREDASSKIFETKLNGEEKQAWIYFTSFFQYRKNLLRDKDLLRECTKYYQKDSIWTNLTQWLVEDAESGILEIVC